MFEESARPLLEFKKTNFVINLGLDPDWIRIQPQAGSGSV